MFDIFRKLSLDFLGEGWQDCYITFRPAIIKEIKKLAKLGDATDPEKTDEVVNAGVEFLKKKFVDGKAIKGGKTVDIKKEDFDELPIEVLNASFELLAGTPSQKK